MKQSVQLCAIKDGNVLAVARRGTVNSWGLPGGKPEKGEDDLSALVREVEEETLLKIDKNLRFVFKRLNGNYIVTTYFYDGDIEEEPRQGDAGPSAWVTWEELISGPFGEYNKKLKESLEYNNR